MNRPLYNCGMALLALVCLATGEARALIMAEYADAHGLQLSECVVYADSTSDLPTASSAE